MRSTHIHLNTEHHLWRESMKIHQILETTDDPFDPEQGKTPDLYKRHADSLVYQYKALSQDLMKLLKNHIIVPVNPLLGDYVRMKGWMNDYGIEKTPENQKYIKKALTAIAKLEQIRREMANIEMPPGMRYEHVEQQIDLLCERRDDIQEEALDIINNHIRATYADEELFIGGDLYDKLLPGTQRGWFLVFDESNGVDGEDSVAYYAEKRNKNHQLVVEVREFWERKKEIKQELQRLGNRPQ